MKNLQQLWELLIGYIFIGFAIIMYFYFEGKFPSHWFKGDYNQEDALEEAGILVILGYLGLKLMFYAALILVLIFLIIKNINII